MNRHQVLSLEAPTSPWWLVGALRLYGSKVTLGKWLGGQDPEEPVDGKVVLRSCSFEVT